MQRWQILRFFDFKSLELPGATSHTQLPTVGRQHRDGVEIYFAGRTNQGYSEIWAAGINLSKDIPEIEIINKEPVLRPGPTGNFDEHGVYPSCVVQIDGRILMYYIGWCKGSEAPMFYANIGVAESVDGVQFHKRSPVPLIGRSVHDPCLVTSPHVIKVAERWLMAYVSGFKWDRGPEGTLRSYYDIKSAESCDGLEWSRSGHSIVPLDGEERNVARPSLLHRNNIYHMWYSFVGNSNGKYRIGYSKSSDFQNWQRLDGVVSFSGDMSFAKEMMCYPSVFQVGSEIFMLLNGDKFGSSGFAIARLEETLA